MVLIITSSRFHGEVHFFFWVLQSMVMICHAVCHATTNYIPSVSWCKIQPWLYCYINLPTANVLSHTWRNIKQKEFWWELIFLVHVQQMCYYTFIHILFNMHDCLWSPCVPNSNCLPSQFIDYRIRIQNTEIFSKALMLFCSL